MENKKRFSNSITKFFSKYSTWKIILVLFVLNIIFLAVIFPYFQGNSSNVLLDLQFSYSPEKAYQLLAQFTADELKIYRMVELTVDLIYPIVYGLLFSFIIFKLSRNTLFSMIPFLVILVDLMENSGIVILISCLPKELTTVATITSIFSSLKWILIVSSVLLILMLLIRKLFTKKKAF